MTDPRTPERTAERLEARAELAQDALPTYQELLDEAVEDTFPASDPIAPNAARHTGGEVRTGVDDKDWQLQPGEPRPPHETQQVVAEFDDEQAARRAQDRAVAKQLPSARLDLPPDGRREGPAATVTVVASDPRQRRQAEKIVREAGAAHVEIKR